MCWTNLVQIPLPWMWLKIYASTLLFLPTHFPLGRLQAFDSPHVILDWRWGSKVFLSPTTMGDSAKERKT